MSNSDEVFFKLEAEDQAAEITLLDGNLNVALNGLGVVQGSLLPGLYEARAMAGNGVWEQIIEVMPGQNNSIVIPHLMFGSAAPLENTAQSHEYHQEAAHQLSTKLHASHGEGSQVFVFARQFSPPSPQPQKRQVHPLQELSLHDLEGQLLWNLEDVSESNLDLDAWAGCNLSVDTGAYRLRYVTPKGRNLEQILFAANDWQTQVFALLGSEDSERAELDLAGAAIEYVKMGRGFQPHDSNYTRMARLTELARQALNNRRDVLGRELEEILEAKFESPMLGLLGAHLLLMQAKPDLNRLQNIVMRLQSLLGQDHPDVAALNAKINSTENFNTTISSNNDVFYSPPMLRRSWGLILETSIKHPELVPVDSLCAQIAPRIIDNEPWLRWQTPPLRTIFLNDLAVPTNQHEQALDQLLEQRQIALISEASGSVFDMQQPITFPTTDKLDDERARQGIEVTGLPRASVEATYRAISHPVPTLTVWLEGMGLELVREAILNTRGAGQASLFVREASSETDAAFKIRVDSNGFRITRAGSERRLGMLVTDVEGLNEDSAKKTVAQLEHMARWQLTSMLENPGSRLTNAIEMKVLIVIGPPTSNDPKSLPTKPAPDKAGLRLEQKGSDSQLPEYQIFLENISQEELYCALLYLDESYSVTSDLLQGMWLKPGEKVWAMNDGMPILSHVPDDWFEAGITEVHDHIKLIVSTEEFDATLLDQDELNVEVNKKRSVRTRGAGTPQEWFPPSLSNALEALTNRDQTRRLVASQPSGNSRFAEWVSQDLFVVTVRTP